LQPFGVDDGVVNNTQLFPVRQVDVKAGPAGHDIDALDHARRFR